MTADADGIGVIPKACNAALGRVAISKPLLRPTVGSVTLPPTELLHQTLRKRIPAVTNTGDISKNEFIVLTFVMRLFTGVPIPTHVTPLSLDT